MFVPENINRDSAWPDACIFHRNRKINYIRYINNLVAFVCLNVYQLCIFALYFNRGEGYFVIHIDFYADLINHDE